MSKATERPFDPSIMPYPLRPGAATYIKASGDIIAAAMTEIRLIDKDIAELEASKKILVDSVIVAKRKIQSYLAAHDSQRTLNDWLND